MRAASQSLREPSWWQLLLCFGIAWITPVLAAFFSPNVEKILIAFVFVGLRFWLFPVKDGSGRHNYFEPKKIFWGAALIILTLAIGLWANPGISFSQGTSMTWYAELLLVVIPEEMFYRGTLQEGIARKVGRFTAVPFAAAAFSLAHVYSYAGEPAILAATSGAAVVLCLAYAWLGTLWPTIGIHFILNRVY